MVLKICLNWIICNSKVEKLNSYILFYLLIYWQNLFSYFLPSKPNVVAVYTVQFTEYSVHISSRYDLCKCKNIRGKTVEWKWTFLKHFTLKKKSYWIFSMGKKPFIGDKKFSVKKNSSPLGFKNIDKCRENIGKFINVWMISCSICGYHRTSSHHISEYGI